MPEPFKNLLHAGTVETAARHLARTCPDFDVRRFPAYGTLSGNTLDALKEGAGERINASNQSEKRDPADFLL